MAPVWSISWSDLTSTWPKLGPRWDFTSEASKAEWRFLGWYMLLVVLPTALYQIWRARTYKTGYNGAILCFEMLFLIWTLPVCGSFVAHGVASIDPYLYIGFGLVSFFCFIIAANIFYLETEEGEMPGVGDPWWLRCWSLMHPRRSAWVPTTANLVPLGFAWAMNMRLNGFMDWKTHLGVGLGVTWVLTFCKRQFDESRRRADAEYAAKKILGNEKHEKASGGGLNGTLDDKA